MTSDDLSEIVWIAAELDLGGKMQQLCDARGCPLELRAPDRESALRQAKARNWPKDAAVVSRLSFSLLHAKQSRR